MYSAGFTVRMASDEIILRMEDSEGSGDGYWNLRRYDGGTAKDRAEIRLTDRFREDRPRETGSDGSIRIDFDLEEVRDVSEEQKEVILQTLLDERGGEEVTKDGQSGDGWSIGYPYRFFRNDGLPYVMILLLFLVFLITALILASGSCYY